MAALVGTGLEVGGGAEEWMGEANAVVFDLQHAGRLGFGQAGVGAGSEHLSN